jgi:hypothetical protein
MRPTACEPYRVVVDGFREPDDETILVLARGTGCEHAFGPRRERRRRAQQQQRGWS